MLMVVGAHFIVLQNIFDLISALDRRSSLHQVGLHASRRIDLARLKFAFSFLVFCGQAAPTYRSTLRGALPELLSKEIFVRFPRREICFLLPELLAAGVELKAFAVEDNSLPSEFSFDKMPLHVANNSAQIRQTMRGKLATGEGLEVYESTLPPNAAITATSHHHVHSEMWLVREGSIELTGER
jgi:hypothetical protein